MCCVDRLSPQPKAVIGHNLDDKIQLVGRFRRALVETVSATPGMRPRYAQGRVDKNAIYRGNPVAQIEESVLAAWAGNSAE